MKISQLFKSKTINFATALGVFGVIEANWQVVAPYLGEAQGWVYTGIAAIMAGLRVVTKKPLAEKTSLKD